MFKPSFFSQPPARKKTPRSLILSILPAVMIALGLLVYGLFQPEIGQAQQPPLPPVQPGGGFEAATVDALFTIRGLAGKCVSFGRGPYENNRPVLLADCNGSSVEQIRVYELSGRGNMRREVQLRAGEKCIGAMGNFIVPNVPIALQDCNGTRGQIFALDGDSMIFAQERGFVIEAKNARGLSGTPLVVGERDLDDSEFWSFTAVDGSDDRPTSGFVRATNAYELSQRLQHATWGTVIEIDGDATIEIFETLSVPSGVTLRGDRRGLARGAELHWPNMSLPGPMLAVNGDYARITALRFRGPTRDKGADSEWVNGVFAPERFYSIIDHNEFSDWQWAGVYVAGDSNSDACPAVRNTNPSSRPQRVRIARNFFHHNQRNNLGYGVGVYLGAYPLIEGNAFLSNRHAIAADGEANTGYRALMNLVLADSPEQGNFIYSWHEHDFDMHGYVADDHNYGGIAGWYTHIAWNSFLGGNRDNFSLRGVPCYLAEFHRNVSMRDRSGSLEYYLPPPGYGPLPNWLNLQDNKFEHPNPTDRLGVGDFDGDGKQDAFLATGAAWYYAPGGKAEWRYLKNSLAELDDLLLGDFDGDGRTDVLTQSGRDWIVSWGGVYRGERINAQDGRISDYHAADFNGDGRDDVFYANGNAWYLSLGASSPYSLFAASSHRTKDLRFGDFNGDGKTDVFGVVGDFWRVVYGGGSSWAILRAKLTDNVNDLVVADFNGDGRADVAGSNRDYPFYDWRISSAGVTGWTTLRNNATTALIAVPAIGQFDATAGADVLFWPGKFFAQMSIMVLKEENSLNIASAGTGDERHSRQDMR